MNATPETSAALPQPASRVLDGWKHQVAGYHAAAARPDGYMLAMGMGCGKSKVAIDVLANSDVRQILILCPKSVLGVWRREFDRHWPLVQRSAEIYLLDRPTCREKAEEMIAFLGGRIAAPATVKIVVANYDAAWRAPLGEAILRSHFDAVVCDESHRIKSPGGKASRWAQRLGAITRRRLCLTGTPMPHSPLDLYGQFRFLAPSVFGTSFARFRAKYAITNPQFPSQVRAWINQIDLQERFHSRAFVCRSEDVLDLPGELDVIRYCALEPKSRRVYDDLERELIAEVDAGTVNVANALAKLLRLQQITSGYVGGADNFGERWIQDLGSEKRSLMADVLEDAGEPVVVFCRFQRDLDAVQAATQSLDLRYGELSGRRRDAIDDYACMASGVDVAGVQIQAGGVGIDLTRAALGVYYSLGFSLGDYLQSRARLHRPGQTRPVRFLHFVAEGTVDEAVYRALEKRQEVVQEVLSTIKR